MGFSKIRLADGREVTVALDGKKVVESLRESAGNGQAEFARFNTPARVRVWVNPSHVAAVEDRPDLE